MMKILLLVGTAITILLSVSCSPKVTPEKDAKKFIDGHIALIEPIMKEMNQAYWDATGSGKDEYYDRYSELELKLRKIYADTEEFHKVKEWHDGAKFDDPLLKRQIAMLYNAYAENQIDPDLMKRMVGLSSKIEKQFNTFRATFEGKKVADNDLRAILKDETDSRRREEAWKGFKEVGTAVADDLLELVKLRNEAARSLGYDDYYVMQLALQEQTLSQIMGIFDELKMMTDEPFRKVKAEIDATL